VTDTPGSGFPLVAWVRIFTQQCTLLDDQPSRIGILGARSLVRDCTFVLNDVTILSGMEINDPGCAVVPVAAAAWGSLKVFFR
jgi:hypothetical protein